MNENMEKTTTGKMMRGASLIEVILSLGLLAGVVVSTASLLSIGRHHAKGGRTASEALSIAQSVLEEMHGWGLHQTYTHFGLDGADPSYVVDTRSNDQAAKWQSVLSEKLDRGYATIAMSSLSPTAPAPSLDSTLSIRVIVTVFWRENGRSREVRLGTARM